MHTVRLSLLLALSFPLLCIWASGQEQGSILPKQSLALSAPFRVAANQAQRDIQELQKGVDAITNEFIDESPQWNSLKQTSDASLESARSQASNPDANYVIRLLTKEQQLISEFHIAFNAGKNDGSFDQAATNALDCNAFIEQVLDGKAPTFGSCLGVEREHGGELHGRKAETSTGLSASSSAPPRPGAASASFHGIRVGQPISTLPFKCTDVVFCNGLVEGNYVRVSHSNSIVDMFDVIYEGTTFSREPITAPPITLAQAVKVHSLQESARPPKLRYASNDRGEMYGIVDLENRISYTTKTTPALAPRWIGENQVVEVSYFSPTAPLLEDSKGSLLREGEAALLADANMSTLYSPTIGGSMPGGATAQSTNSEAATKARGNPSGPFGFEYGMTREEIIKLIGKQAVKETTGDTMDVTTAPKPHPVFESYVLTFSADKGLLAVSALGKDVPTNVFGEEVHSQFLELRAALSKIYGDPSLTADEVQAGSIWNDPQDWMMGLLKKERSVVSIWNLKSAPVNHIAMIMVKAAALSQEKGYNSVKYEFEGFEAFTDAQKAKVDSNF